MKNTITVGNRKAQVCRSHDDARLDTVVRVFHVETGRLTHEFRIVLEALFMWQKKLPHFDIG